jgi:hypothetical protein
VKKSININGAASAHHRRGAGGIAGGYQTAHGNSAIIGQRIENSESNHVAAAASSATWHQRQHRVSS